MKNFKNNIQTIEYNSSTKQVTQTWTDESKSLNESEFKTEMLELAKFFEEHKPVNVLIDMRDFYFVVVPEMQTWVNENVNSKLSGINSLKTAFVVSSDLFASISVEQTLEDNKESINNRFFENENDAEKWLAE